MRRILFAFLLVAAVGCGRKPEHDPAVPAPDPQAKAPPAPVKKTPDTPKNTDPNVKPEKKELSGHQKSDSTLISVIGRRMEIPEVTNGMRQIGLLYKAMDASGQLPSTVKDFTRDLDPKTREALEKGWIRVLMGVGARQMPEGASNTILAYEVDADRQGRRVVLLGDGSVHELGEAEFQKKPKAQGK